MKYSILMSSSISSLHYSSGRSLLPLSSNPSNCYHYRTTTRRCIRSTGGRGIRCDAAAAPQTRSKDSSANQTNEVEEGAVLAIESASGVVRRFYDGINCHDLSSVEYLIAENCVYEDLIFPHPFTGRKAILDFFKKFTDSISKDLQFVIDDISAEDSSVVGVTWHLEWKGRPFPFSKGCSFYRLEIVAGKRQIIYGRDSVEPAIKPGETALVAIRGVTWLLQQFPHLENQM